MASIVSHQTVTRVIAPASRVPRAIRWLFVADLILVMGYLANHFAGEPFWKVSRILDLNGEPTIGTWYSAIKLCAIGIVLSLACLPYVRREEIRTWVLVLAPLVFLAMSLDEVAQIHEWLGEKGDLLLPSGTRTGTWLPHTGFWMFQIGLPFAVACLWLLRRARSRIPTCSVGCRLLAIGMLVFLTGANGWEIVSNFVYQQPHYYALEAAAEELFELTGASMMLWGALQLAVDVGLSVRVGSADLAWLLPDRSRREPVN